MIFDLHGASCHVCLESCVFICAPKRAIFVRTEGKNNAWTLSGISSGNGGRYGAWRDAWPSGSDCSGDQACQGCEGTCSDADGCRDRRCQGEGHVWANENTKVYHKDDAQYGKTKHGKFMTEADAQAGGYRLAKASPIGKKKAAPAATSPQ